MPGPFDFTGQNISNTYQRVVQVISGSLHDGTGSLFIPLSASYAITASYAVSASHEIVKEISSSYAETASFANNFVVQNSLTASNISASFYYGDGSNLTGIETDPFPYTGSAIISGSLNVIGDITASNSVQIGPQQVTLYGRSDRTSLAVNRTPYFYAGNNAFQADLFYTYNQGSANQPALYIGTNGGGAGRGIYGVSQGMAFTANNSTIAYIRGRTNDGSGNDSPRLGIGVDPSAHIDLAAHRNSTRNLLRISGSSVATHTEIFFISSSGNTGIGTWSPNYKLEVVGDISASTYYGDGSNLTGIETDPFPYTGSAIISGSLVLTGSIFAETTPGSQTLVIKSADASVNNNAKVGIGNTTNPAARNIAIGYINSPKYDSVQIGGRNVGGGVYGIAIGDSAASNNSTYSTIAIGGSANRFSNGDIGIGASSLYNDGGVYGSAGTIAIGHNAGSAQDGTQNVILGSQAARSSVGLNSIFVGYHSGRNNIGDNSVILGHSAGYNVTGSNNILLGYQAGYNLTGSNQLIIANNSSSALITGDFAEETLTISGSLEVIGEITGSPSFNIHAPNRSTGIKIGNSTTTTVGDRSTAIGVNATANTYDEISIGYNAGAKGSGNPSSAVYIGNNAGNGGAGNGMGKRVGIGHTALGNNNGNSHVAIGDQAGRFGNGSGNVLIGRSAGYNMGGASQNVAIGQNAGNGSVGDGNITLGYYSNGGDGDYNIALGYRAGNTSMTGTNNVLIGYYAGNTFTNESNKLIITNTGSKALITGDFANNTLDISGSVSASTYYGDGSNLTGIETDPFPYIGSAIITGSLTVSGSVVDFTSASSVNLNIDSLPLINPIVEYLDVTASISSGTSITLPNNLSYVSSSVYEYLEVFMNGLRLRYNRDFVPTSNTTIQNQIHFPSGSELTFKSLKR